MEREVTGADRVLVICTSAYVRKADDSQGGAGYEKMILAAQILRDPTTHRVIPIIRGNEGSTLMPKFLGERFYIDFRDDAKYEEKYELLLRELLGVRMTPCPPLGKSPFEEKPQYTTPKLSTRRERYVSPAMSGVVTFDPSNNNGRYVIGAGDMLFETYWSVASNTAIHVLDDPPSIHSVALASGIRAISDIEDASIYDTSSRHRTPHLGEVVVWQNTAGYFAATRIEGLKSRNHGDSVDEVTFS
jgi:hypothetical protein